MKLNPQRILQTGDLVQLKDGGKYKVSHIIDDDNQMSFDSLVFRIKSIFILKDDSPIQISIDQVLNIL